MSTRAPFVAREAVAFFFGRGVISIRSTGSGRRQNGSSLVTGRITADGSKSLRRNLVQAAHVLLWCRKMDAAKPLQAKVSHLASFHASSSSM